MNILESSEISTGIEK